MHTQLPVNYLVRVYLFIFFLLFFLNIYLFFGFLEL